MYGKQRLVLISKAIDEGEPLAGSLSSPEATVAVGDLLVQFLESLAEPVIPSQQHEACTSATTRDEAYACLDLLPHINTNVSLRPALLTTGPNLYHCSAAVPA